MDFNIQRPIIGQECVCPDGLGRVASFEEAFPRQYIQVDTYIANRSRKWDPHNVQLVRIEFI